MIQSVNYDQHEILENIKELHCSEGTKRFDADITYGNGSFWKNSHEPMLKYDICPQLPGVIQANSNSIPINDDSLESVVYDPPFLTYVKKGRDHKEGNVIMSKRFGGYYKYKELEEDYNKTLIECHRVLRKNGIMVFKCQDIIHDHKMHCTHNMVINMAEEIGFRLEDLFVLAAKSRMAIPPTDGHAPKKQKHARIFHSYFLVLKKIKSKK